MADPLPRLDTVAVIFDLDGTLIDSAADIHATANRVMGEMGHAALSRAEVQAYVGKGVPNLVARLLEHHGQDPAGPLLAPTIARFEAEYLTAHSQTRPYPGVLPALERLAGDGAALGLCTNKPLAPARAVMDHLGLTRHFAAILGGDSLPLRKPDPEHLHATARALDRRKVIFVGDSEVDADTAAAARVPFLLFTEGYRKSPVDRIAHTAAFADWSHLPRLVTDLL
ncbi:phosphoglycolate phosphatase [Tabrizicola oligotrophica]|uniref:phosphoglycolate phosphatase n=1 Tax=Tabrizicola oligotrophica TaxID=2710650 RepID=UPI002AB1437B|nr:phosphoglycolate phosphatase [Tabrizicola oligotrophica]